MANLLKGKPVADAICEELAPRISACKTAGAAPKLAIVRVGEREDDLAYERSIEMRFDKLGIAVQKFLLSVDCAQGELDATITSINNDPAIHGCLIFQPLPAHLSEARARELLVATKDVDGITPDSLFGVFADEPIGFAPCTADACMRVLAYYNVELAGKNAAVVGRSLVIGKPVSMMLLAQNATVTIAHSKTCDLSALCRASDIVVFAIGRASTMDATFTNPNQTVIDVGINFDESTGKLVGDVDFDAVEPHVEAITPVPGGVGSVTVAVLADHVVTAAERALA